VSGVRCQCSGFGDHSAGQRLLSLFFWQRLLLEAPPRLGYLPVVC
jgi:hypothetical protein